MYSPAEPLENKPWNKMMALVCLLFLPLSFALWIYAESTVAKTLYYVFFLIPNYVCGEYIAEKLLLKSSGLSVSQSGFSILRIFLALAIVLGSFGAAYAIWLSFFS